MTMRDDDALRPRRSAIKREAIAAFDSLPLEYQRPAIRLLMRIRNDYPIAKARALFWREVGIARPCDD